MPVRSRRPLSVARRSLLCAAGAALWLGSATPAAAALAIEVVEPQPGAVLAGGELAPLAWRGQDLAAAGVVEWEAFLSLDGGRTFPLRLTPHLDARLSRVSFRVPDLPTRTARLLLRFGDERDEREVGLAGDLEIVGARGLPWRAAALAFPGRGESARPGLAPTVRWIVGSRDGTGWREVETTGESWRAGRVRSEPAFAGEEPAEESSRESLAAALPATAVALAPAALAAPTSPGAAIASRRVVDRLALQVRRNE